MNSLLRLALVSVIGILAAPPRGWAQNAPTIRISGGWSGSQQPATLFKAIEAHLANEPFDPEVGYLLQAADAFTKALFHLSGAKLNRSATYRGPDGDCVVASWKLGEPPNTLLVNDTPYQSIYSFRLGGARRVTADGLISFLQELIVFQEPPLKLSPGEFSIDAGPVSSTVLYFGGRTSTRSPYALVRDLNISGGTDGRDWYISMIVPKVYARAYYPEPLLIPERFPPLSGLLKTWSFDHIWSEVGVYGESPLAHMWARERNSMLTAELVRRGLSEQQFVELLVPSDVTSMRTRLGEVWSGFSDAHAEGLYARYGVAALRRYAQIGPKAEEPAESYFIGDCSPEFDWLAKATLKEHLYWTGPIRYISRCSNATEDLHLLETLTVPDRASESWEFAVGQMRRRLQSQN
jgi:hypothetical protein